MTKFVCFFFVCMFMCLPVFYCLLLGFRFVLLKYIEKGGGFEVLTLKMRAPDRRHYGI